MKSFIEVERMYTQTLCLHYSDAGDIWRLVAELTTNYMKETSYC